MKTPMMNKSDLIQVCPWNPLKRGFYLPRGGKVGVGTDTPTIHIFIIIHGGGNDDADDDDDNDNDDDDGDDDDDDDDTPPAHSQNKRHLL